MEWRNLSDEAKGVIEWAVDPFTDKKETITIKVGGLFHRDCFGGLSAEQLKLGNVNILITEELYKEILKYVTQSEDMEYEQLGEKLVFRLKDGVEI